MVLLLVNEAALLRCAEGAERGKSPGDAFVLFVLGPTRRERAGAIPELGGSGQSDERELQRFYSIRYKREQGSGEGNVPATKVYGFNGGTEMDKDVGSGENLNFPVYLNILCFFHLDARRSDDDSKNVYILHSCLEKKTAEIGSSDCTGNYMSSFEKFACLS